MPKAPKHANSAGRRSGIENRWNYSDKSAKEGIERILSIFSVLPLELEIAGRGVKKFMLDSSTTLLHKKGVVKYWEFPEQGSNRSKARELAQGKHNTSLGFSKQGKYLRTTLRA